MVPNGSRVFPTNPDLVDILGRTDLDFGNFDFWDFVESQISRCPGSIFPNTFFEISRNLAWAQLGPGLGPGLGLGLGPGLGPDAAGAGAGAGAAGRILRSQPDPSPNAPRDQIRRKDPCCDNLIPFCMDGGLKNR